MGEPDRCERCGLSTSPIAGVYRSRLLGPIAIPGIRGVEVCDCPAEDPSIAERLTTGERDLERLREALDDLGREEP